MFTRPDFSELMLARQLMDQWGIAAVAVEYMAVGFGSHHWSVIDGDRRWFVTVDDLDAKRQGVDDERDAAFRRLGAALSAARVVADDGLDFVVAPIRAADGAVLHRIDDRYAAAVYPFLAGTSYPYGEYSSVDHRDAVLGLVARLHDVADPARTGAPTDDLTVPRHDDLVSALDALGERWESGPYGELARVLLGRHASDVEQRFARFDDLAARVGEQQERTVLTHGEPHPANTMMTSGDWQLIDWDTMMIAAPERDLWMMAAEASVVDAYTALTGRTVTHEGLDCYRLWWDLAEICSYTTLLRGPHDDTDDIRESWANLRHYLDPVGRWSGR